ncbi:MAG: NUDIX hydrolase [Acidimicrobiaceae bacterium]|nr:NUDIX hydrolase [Acidimicrobiaceae bacterium]
MIERAEVAVGAIVRRSGELLLVRRGRSPAAGEWSVPGGRVEPGELLMEAVVRELHEETGLRAVCGPLVGWVERTGEDHHFVILDFEATVTGDLEPVAGSDAAEARWWPVSEVAALPLVEGLAEFLYDHGIIPTIA